MADIKQAAKWMEEGKKVSSPRHVKGASFRRDHAMRDEIVDERGDPYGMDLEDLLANDWEIAE